MKKILVKFREFWQRKTIGAAILRILILLIVALPVANLFVIRTGLIPNGLYLELAKYFPQKCQEVVSMYSHPRIYCYTMIEKKYWYIEKWSSIPEPRDPYAPPPGHFGTPEYPSI